MFDGIVNIQEMPTSYSLLAPSCSSLVDKIHDLFSCQLRDYSTWPTLFSIVRLWPTISLCVMYLSLSPYLLPLTYLLLLIANEMISPLR
jgi:hypothetical protein